MKKLFGLIKNHPVRAFGIINGLVVGLSGYMQGKGWIGSQETALLAVLLTSLSTAFGINASTKSTGKPK
jgi:hypothetical protein